MFCKKQSYKKRSLIVLKKTIVIRFLKVQNEWVVFKNDRFFPKTKQSFLKTIEKTIVNDRFQKRLTTLAVLQITAVHTESLVEGVMYTITLNYKC